MTLKRGLQSAFGVLVILRLLSLWIGERLLGARAFSSASESIARIPGLRGVYQRQAFYRRTLQHCGQDVYFGWHSVFSMRQARVGDRVYIGRFCSVGFAEIGEETMLADHVQILSGGHEHTRGDRDDAGTMHGQSQQYERVRVGRGVWIGAGAVVMADVGEGAIVGAGAVVSRPIPAHSIAVGVPARVIKTLPRGGQAETPTEREPITR